METTTHHFLSKGVPVYLTKIVAEGKTAAAFQFVLRKAESYNDFTDETPEEIREIKSFVVDGFKRQLAKAISQNNMHCGQPVNVSSKYAFETQEHSLEISCSTCGAYHRVKAMFTNEGKWRYFMKSGLKTGTIYLREAREICGMSKEEVAAETGLSIRIIENCEKHFGKSSCKDADMLVRLYGLRWSDINLGPDPLLSAEKTKAAPTTTNSESGQALQSMPL